jgi:hypothetical protein
VREVREELALEPRSGLDLASALLLDLLRARELGGEAVGALSRTFASAPPCVGLNVHFEIYCGFHINTTLTSLVFGRSE